MSRPLSIWVTGRAVPAAEALRGSFADMIRSTVGGAWSGAWSVLDCVADQAAFPARDEVAAVILTGSPARIADSRPWMLRTQDALLRLVAQDVPVLGICFGHQLLAMALGGRAGPNPLGREIGTVQVAASAEADALLGGTPPSFPASMTHLDTVLELPPGAAPLASTALDRYAAIRFAPQVWGLQFHPEMDGATLRAYVVERRRALDAEGLDSDALLAGCRDTPESAALLGRFARLAAARD